MQLKNVEDIYPLSPMQETMLFYACSLSSSSDSHSNLNKQDVLFNQTRFILNGELKQSQFKQAWQAIIERHAALRTAFVWEGLKSPQQVVRAQLKVPFEFIDLSHLSSKEQDTQLLDICQKDRQLGFNPINAPLMRVILIACSPSSHQLIWSSHHLVIDRWCIPVIFDELLRLYQQLLDEAKATYQIAPSFKHYITWLKKIDTKQNKLYWLKQLSGFTQQTFITNKALTQVGQSKNASLTFNSSELLHLKKFCKINQLTMASVIQGAWAMVLNQYNQNSDVIFGVVVSGRPPQLEGVEEIIGSFINNLPIRVKFSPLFSVISWLQNLQKEAYKKTAYEHTPATTLQTWSDLPIQHVLFDSILVWLAPAKITQTEQLSIEALPSNMSTSYPLTLSIEDTGNELNLFAKLDNQSQSVAPLADILLQLKDWIITICKVDDQTLLSELPNLVCKDTETNVNHTEEKNLHALVDSEGSIETVQSAKNTSGREETRIDWLEEYLKSEWMRILDVQDIGLDDDFFTLGGTSIKAAQLLASVEKAERKKIPMLSLFQRPTIRHMAKTISEKNWPLNPNVVTAINKSGKYTPVFCIASPDVNTLGYANLSNQLGDDFPVYVIQNPPDINAVRQINASEIPKLASIYVTEMKKIQPRGPYQLIGMCTGSHIAFEMGKQIEKLGETCQFLGIINTWAFYTVSALYKYSIIENRCRYYINRLKTLNIIEAKRLINNKLGIARSPEVQDDTAEHVNNPNPSKVTQQEVPYSIIDDVGWAHLTPNIDKISQQITVFRCKKQQYWRVSMMCLGWTKHAKNIDIIDIKGKVHLEVLRYPYVADIAEKLRKSLLKSII